MLALAACIEGLESGRVLLQSIGLLAAEGERPSWRGKKVDFRGPCPSGAQETQVLL